MTGEEFRRRMALKREHLADLIEQMTDYSDFMGRTMVGTIVKCVRDMSEKAKGKEIKHVKDWEVIPTNDLLHKVFNAMPDFGNPVEAMAAKDLSDYVEANFNDTDDPEIDAMKDEFREKLESKRKEFEERVKDGYVDCIKRLAAKTASAVKKGKARWR